LYPDHPRAGHDEDAAGDRQEVALTASPPVRWAPRLAEADLR